MKNMGPSENLIWHISLIRSLIKLDSSSGTQGRGKLYLSETLTFAKSPQLSMLHFHRAGIFISSFSFVLAHQVQFMWPFAGSWSTYQEPYPQTELTVPL